MRCLSSLQYIQTWGESMMMMISIQLNIIMVL